MKKVLTCALMSLCLLGCTKVTFETTTQDCATIRASATSWLWERQIKGFKFDYLKGTCELETYSSNPDKETIANLLNTLNKAIEKVP
jgi:hypothetical protein